MDEMTAQSQLVSYVETSRKAGRDDQAIRQELVMAGWNSAQIERWWPQGDMPIGNINAQLENLGIKVVQKNKKLPIFFVFTSLLLFLLVIFGLWAGMVYAGMRIPGVSEQMRNRLIMVVYRLPLPKTAEQILLAAVSTNQTLTTYNPDFSVSMSMGQSVVPIGTLELQVKGPVDFVDPVNPKLDMHANLGVNFGGTLYTLGAAIRKVDELVYFKLDVPSDSFYKMALSLFSSFGGQGEDASASIDEIKNNIASVLEHWVYYDTTGLNSEASLALKSKDQSLVDNARENVQQTLLTSNVLPEVILVGVEDIDGVSTYHLQLIPSREVIESLASGYLTTQELDDSEVQKMVQAIAGGVEEIQINAWFGKEDAVLRKVQVMSRLDLASIRSLSDLRNSMDVQTSPLDGYDELFTEKLNISYVLSLRDIGKPVTIETPENAISVMDFGGQLTNALQTQAQKESQELRKLVDEDLTALHKELFVYYAENSAFPASLNVIESRLEPGIRGRLTQYTYRSLTDNGDFILYIQMDQNGAAYSDSSPFYGISSNLSYPHYLQLSEFGN